MTAAVTISERAARRIGQILKSEGDGAMLRISVEGGGCSGFQYKFDVERAQAEDDLVIARDSAVVLVDPASVPFLAGSEVDFVDDLIGASFRVVNPNATASCGCGTSFSIREIASFHAYSDLERQFGPAADRASRDLAEGLLARRRLPAGDQMRR